MKIAKMQVEFSWYFILTKNGKRWNQYNIFPSVHKWHQYWKNMCYAFSQIYGFPVACEVNLYVYVFYRICFIWHFLERITSKTIGNQRKYTTQ